MQQDSHLKCYKLILTDKSFLLAHLSFRVVKCLFLLALYPLFKMKVMEDTAIERTSQYDVLTH